MLSYCLALKCCYYCTVSCSVLFFFFFSSRRRHTRLTCDWSSDVCSSDLTKPGLYASSLSSWSTAIRGGAWTTTIVSFPFITLLCSCCALWPPNIDMQKNCFRRNNPCIIIRGTRIKVRKLNQCFSSSRASSGRGQIIRNPRGIFVVQFAIGTVHVNPSVILGGVWRACQLPNQHASVYRHIHPCRYTPNRRNV